MLPTDLQAIHHLHLLPETDQYNTLGIPANESVTQGWMNDWSEQQKQEPRMHYVFVVEIKDTTDFVGLIALNLGKPKYKNGEVWYKLLPSFWNRGFATEALTEVLRLGFEDLNLHRIEAGCATENIGSIRVLEKVGMHKEGHRRKCLPIRGDWVDNYEFAILEEDWGKRKR